MSTRDFERTPEIALACLRELRLQVASRRLTFSLLKVSDIRVGAVSVVSNKITGSRAVSFLQCRRDEIVSIRVTDGHLRSCLLFSRFTGSRRTHDLDVRPVACQSIPHLVCAIHYHVGIVPVVALPFLHPNTWCSRNRVKLLASQLMFRFGAHRVSSYITYYLGSTPGHRKSFPAIDRTVSRPLQL